jgi:hypothetical protein
MAEFKLGRIKFVWKGAWAAGTNYYKDDVVSAGGVSYICINGHTSNSTFVAGVANWQQMAGGTLWRGTWASTTGYNVGDLVALGANVYVANTAHTSQADLNDDASKWDLYNKGLDWKSDWAPTTLYRINDLVKFGGDVYICTTRHTSSSSFAPANFNIFALGLQFEDAWNNSTQYQIGDLTTYGGYTYIAKTINTNKIPSTQTNDWGVFTTGFNMTGIWSNATAYKTGDVVQQGGWTYVAKADNTAQSPYLGTTGINAVYWTLVVKGMNHVGAWNSSTKYYPGDVVLITSSTYVAQAVSLNVTPPNSTYWQIIGQGGVGASLTERGDLAYREASGAVIGLHMKDGTPSGAAVVDGYVLKASTIATSGGGLEPRYGEFGHIDNVWYVAPNGTDAAGNGRTIDKPFATIKYACTHVTGPATIFIKTGTYQEQLPIRVPTNVSLVGDELRTTIVLPASGTSDDGVTPNSRSRMFLLNNATVLRNMSFGGLTGQFTTDIGNAKRLTTNWPSTSASGAYVALDPTGSITSKSPYIQNCSCFGDHAIGIYLNGADQTGGYKSMVANDFTQVIDDGIAVWAKNGARAELVSVFTYYAFIGYLSESGGVLRALNGNNSYGTYGNIATDIDPTDTGFNGTVNNRANQATIGKMWVGGGKLLAVGWTYQGQAYTSATVSLDAAPINGSNASVTPLTDNGVLSHINVTNAGSTYQYVTGTARGGATSASGVYIALAATDKMTTNNQYLGMRITVLDGTGAGQTAVIKSSMLVDAVSGNTKVVYVQKLDGSDGWDSISGDTVLTTLDASTQYDILPEIKAVTTGYSPSRTAVLKAGIDPATFQFTNIYILDGGAGYQSGNLPTFTITDPLGSNATLVAQVKDGALSRLNYVSRGAGYVNMGVGTVTGDGFAEIAQTGTYLNFLGLSKAPRPGSIVVINGQTSNFLVIQTVSFNVGTGAARVQVSTSVGTATPLVQGNTVVVYEKFSQIRLTGHDYLAIGSGNFASTAYPFVSTLSYVDANKHINVNNGRVFYVATDQDGNLSVGDLFQVNQATGQASLNVSSFNLTGLNSLQLQGGATISQFSTDATLSANSDTIIPTQKAIRSYISSQLGSGSNNLQVNVLQAGKIFVQNNVITTYTGTSSNLSLTADGTGIITLDKTTNYPYTYSQVAALSSSSVVNKDYVDQQFRTTMFGFVLDRDGNLIYTNDVGTLNASVDGSVYTDFFFGNRTTSVAINTSGNLQITY